MTVSDFAAHTGTYLALAASALALGAIVGIFLGTVASHTSHLRAPVLAIANIGRVVPSLAVLTFMLPLLGVGFVPALAALTLLAVPPIVINTDVAFRTVPGAVLDAARGMGMTRAQTLGRVEVPLALPVMFAGVRTAATEVIASAVLAAFIGAGGLGEYVLNGLQANQADRLWTGVIAIAVLALLAEFALAFAQRKLSGDLA